jgi:hypothetical protein
MRREEAASVHRRDEMRTKNHPTASLFLWRSHLCEDACKENNYQTEFVDGGDND